MNSGLHDAILFVQDIPTKACVFGNWFMWSLQDNVEKTRNLNRSICKGKVAMEKMTVKYPHHVWQGHSGLICFCTGTDAEATADIASFCFRKYRSAQDACEQAFKWLSRKYSDKWILEGDIKGCKTYRGCLTIITSNNSLAFFSI